MVTSGPRHRRASYENLVTTPGKLNFLLFFSFRDTRVLSGKLTTLNYVVTSGWLIISLGVMPYLHALPDALAFFLADLQKTMMKFNPRHRRASYENMSLSFGKALSPPKFRVGTDYWEKSHHEDIYAFMYLMHIEFPLHPLVLHSQTYQTRRVCKSNKEQLQPET